MTLETETALAATLNDSIHVDSAETKKTNTRKYSNAGEVES